MDLIAKLEKKQALLQNMLESTKAMKNMVREDDISALGEEAERRQQMMDEVDALDVMIPRGKKYDTYSAREQRVAKEIELILTEMAETDREIRTTTQSKRDEFGAQLKNVKQQKKGIKGYKAQFSQEGSVYFDAKK